MVIQLSEDDLNDIRIHYPRGENHWSAAELGRYLGCCAMTIRNYAIKLGLVDGVDYEKWKAKRREYHKANREHIRFLCRTKYRERRKQYQRDYYRNNPEARERKKLKNRERNERIKMERLAKSVDCNTTCIVNEQSDK